MRSPAPSSAPPFFAASIGEDPSTLPGSSPRSFWAGLILVVLSLISALATYSILTGLTFITPRDGVVLVVLAINIVLIVAMLGLLVWQAMGLRSAWRRKEAGARLHIRIVGLFTIITALPALLLAMAATTTFSRALDGWFSARVGSIVANSSDVARAYVEEHGQLIRTDIVNMARDIDDEGPSLSENPERFRALLLAQTGLRELAAAYVLDRTGRAVLAVLEDRRIPFEVMPEEVMAQAEAGQVPLLLPSTSFRVAAVARLASFPGRFLLVARPVQAKVVQHMRATEASVEEYTRLRRSRGPLKLVHGVMYALISLTAVLAAIWVGMWFASRLVAPIRRLIAAAQEVSHGNLDVALPVNRGEGDLRRLSATFNQMTSGLKRHQKELVTANAELSERRHFIEAVLEGVSAGVVGLDKNGVVTLANASAERLLGRPAGALVGKPLSEAIPRLGEVLQGHAAESPRTRDARREVAILVDGEERTFAVRLTTGHTGEGASDEGLVLTFDDITELVSAQRTAAWADVARRIAHEIKNPLTPIQLSAERLRRKYTKVITEDRDVFDKCTETIIRQVGDVARMVDEFSSFARMPKPEMAAEDLREVVRDAVILYQMSGTEISYGLEMPKERLAVSCDRRLVGQAITNLVKNAGEAIQSLIESGEAPPDHKGRVLTRVRREGENIAVEVIDNGIGLPRQNRTRLLEPYVTTRAKGTGLGLAIVQKVIEQHGGTLTLEDAPADTGIARGAMVRVVLPVAPAREEPAADEAKGQAVADMKTAATVGLKTPAASGEPATVGEPVRRSAAAGGGGAGRGG
jgi:two-component system nitrogen regulation sensor histidine kinase NtrY